MKRLPFAKFKPMKIIGIAGTLITVVTVILTAMSGLLVFKLVRYLDTAQKALPKIEKASQLYIENQKAQKESEK